MAHYRFVTTWLVRSEIESVFEALHDTEAWPQWWKGVKSVTELEAAKDGRDGVGQRFEIVWRSVLPYDLAFETTVTEVARPARMAGHAVGELVGDGRWWLFEDDGVTAVLYEWNVATTKAWMNVLAPLLGPAFRWNHDLVMRAGGVGLARRLGVELIASG